MFKKLMILVAIAAIAPTVYAQQGSQGNSLSLQDCVKLALSKNTSVLQAQYQAESQDARVLSASGGLLPTLSGSGSFGYTDSRTPSGVQYFQGFLLQTGGITINRQYSASLDANYTLFNGFANYATLNQANAASHAADLDFGRSKQAGAYQATSNYLAVFNARDQLKISQDNLARDQQQLETIKEQNSVGSASLAQVYQQQSVVAADEYSLVQAKNSYDQAQASLKFFLGIPVTDSVAFVDSTIQSNIDTTEFVRMNEQFSQTTPLIDKALEGRPDYLAAVENLSASKSALTVAQSAYSPVISLFAEYSINGTQPNSINDNKRLYGGLSLSLPIFNGFQTQSNIQQAHVAVKSSEQTLDATKRQVQLDVYQALLNLNASEKGYLAALNSVAAAKINLETEQEKFKIGGATLLDVLTANAQYTQALSSRVVAAYTYIQAKEQMEFAVGTINY